MFAPPRLASLLFVCVCAAVAMSACGSASPTAPASVGHIVIQASIGSDASAPAVGSIVRFNVDVRDVSGTSVVSLLTVPVLTANSTYTVELDAPVGDGQEITVLAIGDRPVNGNPLGADAGIGVIYRGSVGAVNVHARGTTSRSVTLSTFVPKFQPLQTIGSGVVIRWDAESGAQSYLLTRFYDDVGLITTAVAGTSFTDDTGASRYQIIAVEKGGRRSAPSDFLKGQ